MDENRNHPGATPGSESRSKICPKPLVLRIPLFPPVLHLGICSMQFPQTPNPYKDRMQTDNLRSLESGLRNTGLLSAHLPPISPIMTSEYSEKKSDDDIESMGVPETNSRGKVKKYKCKHCDFVAHSKLNYWKHKSVHFKPGQLLTCNECQFVTEYKHHLDYHTKKHAKLKPYKCSQCPYSCINKSMLNSHLKSHSNFHQYRCGNCAYVSKHCHTFKKHLRSYNHSTPNSYQLDVYGTRQGPKQKSESKAELPKSPTDNPLQHQPTQYKHDTASQIPLMYQPYMRQQDYMINSLQFPLNYKHLLKPVGSPESSKQAQSPSDYHSLSSSTTDLGSPEPLDLSKRHSSPVKYKPDLTSTKVKSRKNRRKGCPFKLVKLSVNHHATLIEKSTEDTSEAVTINNNNHNNFLCQFCTISFGDIILYTMHMGHHGLKDPFTCRMCNEQCKDKVSFFLHITRDSHT